MTIGIVLASCSCTPSALEEIEAVRDALVRGDLASVDRRVHAEYSDALGDRATMLRDLEDLLRAYARVELTFSEPTTGVVPPSTVEVIGRMDAYLEGTPTVKFVGPLRIELEQGRRLLIRSGLLDDLRGIRSLLDRRSRALEANDAEAYADLLHPAYRDGDLDREGAAGRLRRDLPQIRIRHEVRHHRIEVRGPLAHADERYVLTVGERQLPEAVARLTLSRSAGRWLISGGLYAGTSTVSR